LEHLTKFPRERTRIAIVGAAFRMPGVGSEGFWEALLSGKDLVSTVAAGRWAQQSYLHPRKSEPGTSYTFAAGSIGDVSGFDAAFFGISPREAEQMDPQQRLLLEMTWEAFENAAIRPSSVRGSRVGVFVGLSAVDYAYCRADDLGSIDANTMTGSTGSIAANRISYAFDLLGPSMAIDTACSSSLVALHQACQSIRTGESDAAVVGGVSLHLHPYGFIGFSKASMLSRQGRCSVFDEHGDGYVRSEGGAVVLLKPLAQAIAEGNRIQAVILETGINNDGRKVALTVPSHASQAALLREVYERAGIAPADIDYLEAHGTGTAVGDPIEARAIGEALGQRRPAHQPLPIGSVKSQVGHLEAASGMAGLIKGLHVLRHRRVPGQLHLDKPNPNIDFAGWNLVPVIRTLELDVSRRVVVGVSAFGFGGTNAHAVLTSFESGTASPRVQAAPCAPLLMSARAPAALREGARRMSQFLRDRSDLSDYDIAWSAMFARDTHTHRLCARTIDRSSLAEALERFAATGTATGVVTGRSRRDASAPAFVFSGNGSQWVGMGLQLLDQEAVFRETIEEIDLLFGTLSGRSIIAELRAAPVSGGFERTEVAQPALFAVQAGLTRLFERQGIRPVAVCGHSVGEVAAAWASGALSVEAAVRVIHARSTQQAVTRGRGAMAAVGLGKADAEALLEELALSEALALAAVNGPNGVAVAGDDSAVAGLASELARRAIMFRRLPLDYAFHSAAMDPIREDLLRSLQQLECEAGAIPLYSTVTGAVIDGASLGADYWWRNVREPVRFLSAIQAMLSAGINTFVEIGPRPVLLAYLNEIGKAAGKELLTVASMTTDQSGGDRIRSVSDQLELSGALHDPSRLFPVPGQAVELPHYPWQRERYWYRSSASSLGLLTRHHVHPLLGYALAGESLHWENHLDTNRMPALADHVVAGSPVFPAAGFVEMALAAGALQRPGSYPAIEDLEIQAPLLLEKEHSRVVRLRIQPEDGSFKIVSREREGNGDWRTHAVGRLVDSEPVANEALLLPEREPDVTAEAHYALASSLGLHYGPAFQAVTAGWHAGGSLIGSLTLPQQVAHEADAALLHPACLDGALQLFMDVAWRELGAAQAGSSSPAFLPVRIDRLELVKPGAQVRAARVIPRLARNGSRRSLSGDLTLYDGTGAAIANARGVRFRAATLKSGAEHRPIWIATRAIAMPRRDDMGSLPLPTPQEAARLCAGRLHAPCRLESRRRFTQEVEPLLDVLCAAFAERMLRSLSGGDLIDAEALAAAGYVSADGRHLLQSLLQVLAEEGVICAAGTQWKWSAPDPQFPAPEDIWRRLIGDYPDYATIISSTGTAGVRLTARLRAGVTAEPRERHLAESVLSWMDSCTQEEAAGVFGAINAVLAASAVRQAPEARLRVLYVLGASRRDPGTAFLPTLDHSRCDLLIGSATRAGLETAQSRYPAVAALPGHITELDHLGAPSAQEMGGRFDILVLSGGLADAPDPRLRLANVRSLMREGGLLITVDQHPSRADDLAYGVDPGWWRVAGDAAGRVHPRRREPEGWEAALQEAGFAEVQSVADTSDSESGAYVLVARAHAPAVAEPVPEPQSRRTWLIVADATGYSAELTAALQRDLTARGQRVLVATAATSYSSEAAGAFTLDACSAEHWERLLAELQRSTSVPDAWVHLAGLDLGTGAAPPETRAAVQEARAAVLLAWLQACMHSAIRPQCWVVAAQAGSGLVGVLPVGADGLRDAALWGLTRVAMQEFPELRLRWVDLTNPWPSVSSAASLAQEMLDPDAEDEILLTTDGRFVVRIAASAEPPLPVQAGTAPAAPEGVRLDFSSPGPFRNLTWRADAPRGPIEEDALREGELEIAVRAAGLNFRDVMYAMGLLPDEAIEDGFCGPTLGMEAAGVVLRAGPGVEFAPGDEVIAIAPASFATRVRTQAFAVTRKPTEWSFTAAATVPTAFFTAYYALAELAQLQPGERVLIHGAAGGVGMAAIQIARHLGAEVFATAGTAEKRDLIQLLGADRVFDSRSLAFAEEILRATHGEGVDVVLNSLAGEAMRRNLRLLRPFGRMIELGKRDFYENSRLGLRPFRNNIAYFGIDADQLIARRPHTARRVLGKLMELFAQGLLHPLPHRAFCASEIEAAFRHMQAARHIGKIVITFPEGFDPVRPRPVEKTQTQLRADATYLVTGGLSGLGLRTARWLAQRGARHLALLSRTGAAGEEAHSVLEELRAAGVTVVPIACDVADRDALRATLDALANRMPPVRGIVHAAMVIEDALIRDMDRGQLHRVLAPKFAGAINLHHATLECQLDFFLLYSSATTSFGNPGQGSYVAANMAMEALARERRAKGLPVTCISWGPIGDTGYLARNDRVREALVGRIGGRALCADEALRALDGLLAVDSPPLGLLELDWGVLSRFLPQARSPKFSELARRDRAGASAEEPARDLRSLLAQLPEEELLPAVTNAVRDEIAQILRIAPERIETTVPLAELGMDSLMAVELATSLESQMGIEISALSLGDAATIERIAARVARQLRPAAHQPEGSAGNGGDLAEQVRQVAVRHAGEVSLEVVTELGSELQSAAPAQRIIGRKS
jgi:acyl transferase domain-containing protein/NADPH:quinone reductase-like Zn-dependent oxidoreductase/acyl carrier protein